MLEIEIIFLLPFGVDGKSDLVPDKVTRLNIRYLLLSRRKKLRDEFRRESTATSKKFAMESFAMEMAGS